MSRLSETIKPSCHGAEKQKGPAAETVIPLANTSWVPIRRQAPLGTAHRTKTSALLGLTV